MKNKMANIDQIQRWAEKMQTNENFFVLRITRYKNSRQITTKLLQSRNFSFQSTFML